jgi:heat shock protein HslJ
MMKRQVLICGLAALMIGMVSCKPKQNGAKTGYDKIELSAGVALAEDITEKYWKLTELYGEAVTTPEGGREAHIILKKEDNRVTGNGGCNILNGSYTLETGNRIRFSQMVSTMMMCVNMDVEMKMKQVLEMADNYTVKDNILTLNKARMAPLARFEAVYMK